ncbi:MAG: 50S ribosomal protein L15 [Candidatus Shapirobacteria bacterium]
MEAILSTLNKTTAKSAKRIGRGIGSGKGGHTTGRGQKGQNSRGKIKLTFDGTKIKKSWLKRLPFLRGKHLLLPKNKTYEINLSQLESWFKDGQSVDKKAIFEKIGKVNAKDLTKTIKVLGAGKLTKKLTLKDVQLSQSARQKIVSLGGKIES